MESVKHFKVDVDFSTSDHCPVTLSFNIEHLSSSSQITKRNKQIKWVINYSIKCENFQGLRVGKLRGMRVNTDETGCIIANCGGNNHKPCIHRTYKELNSLIKQCGLAVQFGTNM